MTKIFLMIATLLFITGCSTYTLEEAKKEGAIVEGPGGPLNLESLERFFEDVDASIKGELRIVRFDDEGKPHIGDVIYTDEHLQYRYGDKKATCKGLRVEENPASSTSRQYLLTGCDRVIGQAGPEENEIAIYLDFQ
ncbi:DUF4362 domain-containing protein [Paenibacillus sp. LHD-117]|uniref:DUF4362 domain-containing protein n=1 Tax=Paenibacillus sp. LHD-117 TaxID=3071412 RepID=UPI0027E1A3E6|nr:DUF4362 domain-containing protein [Paenibacillus sp. LHD-117]MDQ6421495.1 DUF4362 domain-containing protein [Paenibacillus sp. LHD-117]